MLEENEVTLKIFRGKCEIRILYPEKTDPQNYKRQWLAHKNLQGILFQQALPKIPLENDFDNQNDERDVNIGLMGSTIKWGLIGNNILCKDWRFDSVDLA